MGPSKALVGTVVICSAVAIAGNVWFALWDYLAFPGPLTRFMLVFFGGLPWLLTLSFTLAGVVMWRRGRVASWVGRMSAVGFFAMAVGAAVLLTNAPMKVRFYFAVAAHGGDQSSLSWPRTATAESIDCRSGDHGTGREYSTGTGETIYYCPDGINVDALGTNRSDFDPMVGDWWVDFNDD